MLNKVLFRKIEEKDICKIWFQQDGAICRTAKATLYVLRIVFKNRIISSDGDTNTAFRDVVLNPNDDDDGDSAT